MQVTKETPTRQFTIQDRTFVIPAPFGEGHQCNAAEAGVLNQTLAENVRNNMNKKVKDGIDAGSFNQDEMQAEIDLYIEEYEFGARRGRGPVDPVEREALNIAKDEVKNALRRSGHKIADIATEDINRLAEQVVSENPDIAKEAERRIKEKSKIGIKQLDLSTLGAQDEDGS